MGCTSVDRQGCGMTGWGDGARRGSGSEEQRVVVWSCACVSASKEKEKGLTFTLREQQYTTWGHISVLLNNKTKCAHASHKINAISEEKKNASERVVTRKGVLEPRK